MEIEVQILFHSHQIIHKPCVGNFTEVTRTPFVFGLNVWIRTSIKDN